ncbi:HK97 gp10 family phage protein [Zhenhengia yiwuensis]|uniref:HK97 gp10 family phage protein n=1 Tax=Zhenhengia yiwuensis TaxID=2763666 RepID=A0A926EKK1_9FIRM|nr:HK97 gp10 family phage protein [Zhenhengia yiwuensis]MBC8581431.1 HK97 gp10 family phage protein [Zhenhengia yiwuensis]
MAKNDVFQLNGVTDLQKKLSFVTKSYADESEKLLIKMGNQFRKEVKKKTPERPYGTSKKKLVNSYKVSRVKGYGRNLYVEFKSTSPHFHLVERGYRIVVGGKGRKKQDTGKRVDGKYMVKRTTLEFEKELPQQAEKMVNRVVKKLL